MRQSFNGAKVLVAAGMTILACGACASHSHKSVRTYDYSEEDDRQPQAQSEKPSELNSEYQMVSPGEMVVEPR